MSPLIARAAAIIRGQSDLQPMSQRFMALQLLLLITRIPRLRKMYVAGIMQACQKEATTGRCSIVGCAPSSRETHTRSVGPMRRMNQYPAALITLRAMRWRRLNLRGPEMGWVGASRAAAGTGDIVKARAGAWGRGWVLPD